MTQDMRHEFPVASNGTHRHVNGSLHTAQKNGLSNGTTGHSPTTNGADHTHTNGFSPSKVKVKPRDFFGHDREEVTRLLIQGLEDLGYREAAESLIQESGYQVESSAVAAFRRAVLEGGWSDAESILFVDTFQPDGGGVSIRDGDMYGRDGLELAENADEGQLKFLIREQKYVELLRHNKRAEALTVLQSELQPLKHDVQRLNILSG